LGVPLLERFGNMEFGPEIMAMTGSPPLTKQIERKILRHRAAAGRGRELPVYRGP